MLRRWISPKRRPLVRHEGFDDLRACRRYRARHRQEPDADLFVLAPDNLAAGFQAIKLDDELKGIRHIEGAFNAQMCARSGEIAHNAGDCGETIVESDDPRLQDTAARRPRHITQSGLNYVNFGVRRCHNVFSLLLCLILPSRCGPIMNASKTRVMNSRDVVTAFLIDAVIPSLS